MSLHEILSAWQQNPALSGLSFHGLTAFLRMAALARPVIRSQQADTRVPPASLHLGLLELLGASLCEADLNLVQMCWVTFKAVIWNYPC
ncbi:hypothetical protein FB45DRAFT_750159 [Roridomyces roridus]|uniref:Uncharacterized protein n=1 Tax=Roridomyces roridus TaxID=1738132 RepID=A0AAD7FIK7_9AGAR|nr:hypothetical protein FB45DRAFT_750159 [Roridomyces roridus]